MSEGEIAAQVVQLLVAPAAKDVVTALVGWIKRRFKSDNGMIKAVERIADEPRSISAKKIVEGSLQMALEEDPSLVEELRGFLDASDLSNTVSQKISAGDHNTIVQIQGRENRV